MRMPIAIATAVTNGKSKKRQRRGSLAAGCFCINASGR